MKVAILTSSDDPEERAFCLARKADAFPIKPMGMDGYQQIVQTLAGLISKSVALCGRSEPRRSV